jgi:hypothetical protein
MLSELFLLQKTEADGAICYHFLALRRRRKSRIEVSMTHRFDVCERLCAQNNCH